MQTNKYNNSQVFALGLYLHNKMNNYLCDTKDLNRIIFQLGSVGYIGSVSESAGEFRIGASLVITSSSATYVSMNRFQHKLH